MNFLLVFSKIHKGYLVSKASNNSLYVSSFLPENFIYNIMDKEKYGSPYDMTIHIYNNIVYMYYDMKSYYQYQLK